MSDSPLWRPGRIGPMELKNRVIRSATNEHLSQPDGQLTTAWMDTLVELAENEVGLVITGHLQIVIIGFIFLALWRIVIYMTLLWLLFICAPRRPFLKEM